MNILTRDDTSDAKIDRTRYKKNPMKIPSYRKSVRDKPNTADVSTSTTISKATAYFVTVFARLLVTALDSWEILRASAAYRETSR